MDEIKGRKSYRKTRFIDKDSAGDSTLKAETKKKHTNEFKTNHLNKLFFFFLIIIVLSCFSYLVAILYVSQTTNFPDICSFKDLQSSQNLTETTNRYLDMLHSNVNDMRPDDKTGAFKAFLFVYDGSTKMKLLFDNLAQRIAECYVNSTEVVRFPIEEFTANEDYGRVISQFVNILDRGRVVQIGDLNEIPSKTAMALHFICDTYTPLASNVIILMSLVVDAVKPTPSKGSKEKLKKLWYKLKKDEMDPLINRLTEVVVPLEAIKKVENIR